MGVFEQARHARRADGTAAVDRLAKGHGLAVTHEQFGCCLSRRRFASVISLEFATDGVVMQQERAATQT